MALQRRRLLAQSMNLGYGTDTIPDDSGGTLVGDKIGIHTFLGDGALNPNDFDGADLNTKLTAAIAALPSTGGVIDARGMEGNFAFSNTVVVNKDNVRLLLGASTLTAPVNKPMFQFWSGTTRYNGCALIGMGTGQTTLKVKAGSAPTGTTFCNIIELTDPEDLNGDNFSERAYIANMTLDGNKSNVTQPGGAASDDLTHSGIYTTASRYSIFENLELKNFWYMGLCGGLYFQFNRLSNIYTSNNGYSNVVGYAGIQIGGSSWHNTVVNHVSESDVNGIMIYDNARFNTVSGTYRNNFHGVTMTDQGGNVSNNNHVIATIYNSGSQALSVGGSGTHRNSIFDVTIDTTTADAGVFVGSNVTACDFNLVVRNANGAGIDFRGDYNNVHIYAHNNSQGSALSNYGIELTGAVGNQITGVINDDQGVVTQRAVLIDSNSNNNSIKVRRHGSGASISDSGTANVIEAPLDGGTLNVTNLNTSPILYNSSATQFGTSHMVFGSATIGGGGTVTVTLSGAAVYTSSGTFVVCGNNESNANPFKITRGSGSEFTITGTASDQITYIAVGN